MYALQYLDAPKNAYIDTGFAPNNNTRVVFDVTVRGTLESWFGVSDDSSGNWWKTKVFGVSNDGGGVYSGFGNLGGTAGSVAANGRHTIEFDKGVFKVDGAVHTTHSGQTFQLSRSLYTLIIERNRMKNVLDGLNEGIVAIGADGAITHNNPALERMFASHKPVQRPLDPRLLVIPDESVWRDFDEVLRGGEPISRNIEAHDVILPTKS